MPIQTKHINEKVFGKFVVTSEDYPDMYGAVSMRSRIRTRELSAFGAVCDGTVVGVILSALYKGYQVIEYLFVQEEYRNKGVASLLLNKSKASKGTIVMTEPPSMFLEDKGFEQVGPVYVNPKGALCIDEIQSVCSAYCNDRHCSWLDVHDDASFN